MAIFSLNSIGRVLKWKFLSSRRVAVITMTFLAFFSGISINVSMSVAIVAMTSEKNVTLENGTVVLEKEFNWDSKEQGLVLSSYYYGFTWTQLLGGILASKFGGHIVLAIGNGMCGFLMLLLPIVAKAGIYYFIAVRIVIGLFAGVAIPAALEVISKWAPINERTTIMGIIVAGMQCGTVATFLLSGYFAQYLGWQSIFYIIGSFALAWLIIWMIYIKNDPASDPRISPEERAHIEANLEDPNALRDLKTPWKAIFTSPAVYAYILVTVCDRWSRLTFLAQIPTFLRDVVGYDMGTTGILAAAPYILGLIVSLIVSPFLDYIRSRKILSTQVVRKLGTSTGFLLTIVFLTIMPNLSSEKAILACLIITVGVSSLTFISCMANPLDIAPNYAGIITGIGDTFSMIPGLVSPIFTGFVVKNGDQDEWRTIFYTSAGFCALGLVFYAIFAKGEVQEWAKIHPTNTIEMVETEENQKTSTKL